MKCKKCNEATRVTNTSKINGVSKKYRFCLNCRFRFRTVVNPVSLKEEFSGELEPIVRNHELHPAGVREKWAKRKNPKRISVVEENFSLIH